MHDPSRSDEPRKKHISEYVCMRICTYIYIYVCGRMCGCLFICVHIFTCLYIYIYTQKGGNSAYVYIYTYIHTYIHTYIYMYAFTYPSVYLHTHTTLTNRLNLWPCPFVLRLPSGGHYLQPARQSSCSERDDAEEHDLQSGAPQQFWYEVGLGLVYLQLSKPPSLYRLPTFCS